MLQKIRDNSQGIIAKIFLGLVIAVFALFGVDSIVGTFVTTVASVSVNGEDIVDAEIQALTQSKAQEYFASLGDNANLADYDEELFRQAAIDELIQRELLMQAAERADMLISSASVDRRIAQTPDFQVGGVFSNERASLLLQNMGYTPNSYRATLAREGVLNQLLAAYSATGFTTAEELERLIGLSHQKRSFRFLGIGLDSQAGGIDV